MSINANFMINIGAIIQYIFTFVPLRHFNESVCANVGFRHSISDITYRSVVHTIRLHFQQIDSKVDNYKNQKCRTEIDHSIRQAAQIDEEGKL